MHDEGPFQPVSKPATKDTDPLVRKESVLQILLDMKKKKSDELYQAQETHKELAVMIERISEEVYKLKAR